MKLKISFLAIALLISALGFAQKNEPQRLFVPNSDAKQQLDSVVMPLEKHFFKYDTNGNEIEKIEMRLNGTDWENWVRETYKYNAYGYQIEVFNEWWDGSNWAEGVLIDREFDHYGHILRYADYFWSGSGWEGIRKDEFDFDSQGTQIMDAHYEWGTTDWVGVEKKEYVFDKHGNPLMRADYTGWDPVHNVFIGDFKHEFDYTYFDDNTFEYSLISSYSWDFANNVWDGIFRTESEYDNQKLLIMTASFNWEPYPVSKWVNKTKYISTYDANGKKLSEIEYIGVASGWEEAKKMENEYKTFGIEVKRILEHSFIWDAANTKWDNDFKMEYDYYGAAGYLYVYFNKCTWNGAAWDTLGKRITSYDTDGITPLVTINKYFDSGNWINQDKWEYTCKNNEVNEMIHYLWIGGTWKEDCKNVLDFDVKGFPVKDVLYNWSGSGWEEFSMIDYAYDSNENLTLERTFYWVSGAWVKKKEHTAAYANDDNEYPLFNEYYLLNGTNWIGESKSVFAYDANKRKILDVSYDNWDNVNNCFIGSYKYEWAYDNNGNKTMEAEYDSWDATNLIFIGKTKGEWAYDENGREIMRANYPDWDNVNHTWKGEYKDSVVFNANDKKIFAIRFWWPSTNWVPFSKQTFEYNAAGNETSTIVSFWDGANWVENSMRTKTYDANENPIVMIDYFNFGSGLEEDKKYEWGYDLSYSRYDLVIPYEGYNMKNKQLFYDKFIWSGTSWNTEEINIYYWSSCNITPIMLTILGKVFVAGTNNPLEGVIITCSGDYETSATTNNGGEYMMSVERFAKVILTPSMLDYTFTPESLVCEKVAANLANMNFVAKKSGKIVPITNNNLRVYPNPTTGELRMENGEWRIMNVEVYDVFGRNVSNLKSQISNQKIDISPLATGVYFLRIQTDKGVVTKKIIKN
jgi:hypothetical protein